MKKNVLFILLSSIYCSVYAQVGIGTSDPKATLDIEAVNKTGSSTAVEGIIIPRVDRLRAQSMTDVIKSTIIYVDGITTGAQTGSAININTEGFYTYSGSVWVKMPNASQISDYSYWKAQPISVSTPKNQENNKEEDSLAAPEFFEYNIFQKGKVGIGYNKEADVDFKTNTTLKQLEVGGDFRTVFYNPEEIIQDYFGDNDTIPPLYFGIETNSKALPEQFSLRGNVIYNAETKDLRDYSFLVKEYNGSMFLQSRDQINLLSRTGKTTDKDGTFLHEFQSNSKGLTELVSNIKAGSSILNELRVKVFNVNDYSVRDNKLNGGQFGLDFIKNKFYIGPKYTDFDVANNQPVTIFKGYYFPNEKPIKDAQILKYNATNQSLEWADATSSSASPKFFYMPSIVLPTTPSGVTQYVTYDSGSQTYTVDLYAIYSAQFGTSIKSSNGNTNGLAGFVLSRDKYEYHIIYADATVFPHADIVFSTTAGEEGKFTYKVDGNAIVRNGSFMNIVLKVK